MRRAAAVVLAGAVVLVAVSHAGQVRSRHPMAASAASTGAEGPELAARVVVAALLRNDVSALDTWSTLDPAGSSRQPVDPRDLTVDTYVLHRDAHLVRVVAQISGPGSAIAAVTVEAALVDGSWRIVGVAP